MTTHEGSTMAERNGEEPLLSASAKRIGDFRFKRAMETGSSGVDDAVTVEQVREPIQHVDDLLYILHSRLCIKAILSYATIKFFQCHE